MLPHVFQILGKLSAIHRCHVSCQLRLQQHQRIIISAILWNIREHSFCNIKMRFCQILQADPEGSSLPQSFQNISQVKKPFNRILWRFMICFYKFFDYVFLITISQIGNLEIQIKQCFTGRAVSHGTVFRHRAVFISFHKMNCVNLFGAHCVYHLLVRIGFIKPKCSFHGLPPSFANTGVTFVTPVSFHQTQKI